MEKKTSTAAIVVAVIASVILIPVILLVGFLGSTATAASELVRQDSEEFWFASFEESGGIAWIYELAQDELKSQEVELKREIKQRVEQETTLVVEQQREQWENQLDTLNEKQRQEMLKQYEEEAETKKQQLLTEFNTVLDESDILNNVVAYEEFSAIVHGIYSSILNRGDYQLDLSVQGERIKEKLTSCLKQTEIAEYFEESDLDMLETQVDTIITSVENQLNEEIEQRFMIEVLSKNEPFRPNSRIEVMSIEMLSRLMRFSVIFLAGLMVVLLLLLLVAHLFRPSGFFVTGAVMLLFGACLIVFALIIRVNSLEQVIVPDMIPHVSVINLLDLMKEKISKGYQSWGIWCTAASVVFFVIGGITKYFACHREKSMV